MILKFHVKFCSTLAENSTGQLETEVRLARFNNVHIITATEDEKYPYRALFSRPYLRNGERPNNRYATLLPFPTPVTTGVTIFGSVTWRFALYSCNCCSAFATVCSVGCRTACSDNGTTTYLSYHLTPLFSINISLSENI